MKWSKSGVASRDRVTIFLLAAILVFSGTGIAQQQGSPSPSESTPRQDAPAKPISDAAQSASGAAQSVTKSDDRGRGEVDQVSSVTLGPGDLIEVNVYNVPELASKVRVSNSGDVYLPLIDYVHVDGLTQEEAQALIEKRLSDGGFVRNPHVTIFVDEAASQGVTILGEVNKPGIYPDTPDRKLYDIISQAGGFTQQASRKISVMRKNKPETIHVELPRNLADDASKNIDILPGDTVSVPKAPIIYVVGDVGRPSGLLVDNGTLTVLQALALAGGTNKTAKLGGARIIRKGPQGMSETKVEIKKMLEAKAPDVTLQADDILFIPISGGKVFAARTFEAAMSAATAVTIYTVHP
jgi:polysaccharide export outer membrane protein